MSGLEQLKITFFEECNELLQSLETSLADIREGTGNDDTVHAVFRAVHSIKGGAGVFGFAELIEFAHVFETVMDEVRKGNLATSPDVIDILLRANDTLADLVEMARKGEPVAPGYGGDARHALETLLSGEPSKRAAGSAPAAQPETEEFSFVPVKADSFDDQPQTGGLKLYSISFRPKPDILKKSIDPGFLLNVLRSMGKLDLTADTAAIPALQDMQHDDFHISWSGTLETESPRQEIESIFAPVAAECEFQLTDMTPAAAAPAPAAEPAPQPIAPAVAAPDAPAPVVMAPVGMAPAVPPAPVAASFAAPAAPPPPPEASGNGKEARGAAKQPSSVTIRVELDKIDRVVNMVGELVIAQAMLHQVIDELPEHTSARISNILSDLVRHTRGLKDSVMAIRAQPVSSVFQRMPRLVRELSAKTGKKVQIEMFGETTEVDKTIIERLSDPLTHIIRNSIDHGIEPPGERVAKGKYEEGTIRMSAEQRGGRIVIEIADDGGGINCERVLKKAKEKGLVDPNAVLTDDEICNLIFLPGFSTAETVSDISGRGVGMDVVRRNIQDLGGRTTIKSEFGRGTTIQLALPLTLAVMDGLVVEVARQTYVLPIPNIVECLRPGEDEIHRVIGAAGALNLRGDIVPLIYLADVLGVDQAMADRTNGVVIITEASDGTRMGLIVDDLIGNQQVVIKSIEENCGTVQGIAGATILGDGHVAFILDIEMLANMTSVDGRNMPPPGASGAANAMHLN
ncbi:MAG: chemotaxis protein CheA [Xanthobacteraceae bacterium]|nr:chemotaxis protein CheA [Xanthobacteraceae bacterium]